MNELSDLFAATAEDAPPPRGLVAASHARAARRVTRARWVAATASVAAVAAVAAVAVARPEPEPMYVALGSGGAMVGESKEQCYGGTSGRVPGSEMPPALRLVSDDPGFTQARPALARRMESPGCGSAGVPLALVDTDARGVTERALTLTGPLPAAIQAATGRTATVRGVRGSLLLFGDLPTGVTWRERGGSDHWLLQATGVSEAQLLAYADALVLGADGSARLPGDHGFRDLGTIPARASTSKHLWYLQYRNRAGHEIEIEASEHAGPVGTFLAGAPAGRSQEVSVNGARGVWFTNGDALGKGLQHLQWEVSPGVKGSVSGLDLTLRELMDLATSVRPAPDDHPAVTTAE